MNDLETDASALVAERPLYDLFRYSTPPAVRIVKGGCDDIGADHVLDLYRRVFGRRFSLISALFILRIWNARSPLL